MLPFALLAVAAWMLPDQSHWVGHAFLVYGLAITAFLAGTVWGTARTVPGAKKVQRVCVSNVFVVIGAAAVIAGTEILAASVMLLLFWAIYLYERHTALGRGWYLQYRLQLTVVVSVCHFLFIGALLR